ncbi:MAG: glycosyl hydrolase family 28-related protein [Candidatus Aerophobetes bacterium]|nr:glycosyl hydrolase family 28-related protein [Candidatus Aerophobetes bacterium]
MAIPTNLPEWDKNEVNIVEVDQQHKDKGWLAPAGVPEKPPFQSFNWWQNLVYKWILRFKNVTGGLDTMTDLLSFIETVDGTSVNIRGYHSTNDGGGGAFNYDSTIDKSTANGGTIIDPDQTLANQGSGVGFGCWVRQYSDVANVKEFGAVGDGTTDDTISIQRAVDTGKSIHFPIGTYTITDTITIATRGQELFGEAGSVGGKANITTNEFGSTIQFDIGDIDPAQEMFRVTESQVSFTYLKFKGDSVNPDDIGIIFNKLTNTDDMDGYVLNCDFTDIRDGIQFYSRALQADNNVFSDCSYSITLDWDGSAESGLDIHINDLYKGRATRITNNRFHGGVFAVTVQNYLQRGAIYSNNTVDIGQGFIRVQNGGGLYGCVIDSNIGDLLSQTFLRMDALTICRDVIVSNNKMGGAIAGTVDATDKRPFSGINFNGLSEIKGFIFVGNTITGTDASAIFIRNDVASPAITAKALLISNNIFRQIGLDGAASRNIFFTVFDVSDFMFTNNIILEEGGTVTAILASSSNTITDTVIKDNIYNPSIPLISSITFAGKIDVNYKQGGYGINSLAQFQIGDLGAYTSSLPMLFSRVGSTGGIGTRYTNSAGTIDILGTPTGSGNGAFTPGNDNQVSSGAPTFRWSVVYAGTGTINTSDDREKSYIDITDVEKQVALELKINMKKFKYNDAIQKKGEDRARIHFGASAQTIKYIFEKHGLIAEDYAILCYDEWEQELDDDGNVIVEAGNRYGLRYEELLSFIISAI